MREKCLRDHGRDPSPLRRIQKPDADVHRDAVALELAGQLGCEAQRFPYLPDHGGNVTRIDLCPFCFVSGNTPARSACVRTARASTFSSNALRRGFDDNDGEWARTGPSCNGFRSAAQKPISIFSSRTSVPS